MTENENPQPDVPLPESAVPVPEKPIGSRWGCCEAIPQAADGAQPCPGPHTVAEEDQAQRDAAPDAEEEAKPQQEQPEQ